MIRAGVVRGVLGAGIAVLGACEEASGPPACAPPAFAHASVAPNPSNVLSGIGLARVEHADSIAMALSRDGTAEILTPAVPARNDTTVIPALALHPSTRYEARLLAFSECGKSYSGRLSLVTGNLPSDLPSFSAVGTDPSPGYVAFAAGSYGLVIDNTGRVVWYHHFPGGPGLNFQPQRNGRYAARPAPAAGKAAAWIEIDPLGIVSPGPGCTGALHARPHDMIAQPDGSYWLLCDQTRTIDLSDAGGSSQSLVSGTGVQHIGAQGQLVFEWYPFDHMPVDLDVLDPADRSAIPINWTHGNALDLDADGNLLVSLRNLSEITKIDTRTGDVIWRMGGKRNQFTFENTPAPAFSRQHGVRSRGGGKLQLLDNLGDPSASRVERYEYDERSRTVRQLSSFASSDGVIARVGGTAQPLPSGRTLVSFGNGGSVEETDASGNVVWRITGNPGYVFRAHRIRSLYRPGAEDPR